MDVQEKKYIQTLKAFIRYMWGKVYFIQMLDALKFVVLEVV